ncbi:MAG: hypothetical protein QM581_02570 [Pseudomonas sp.]
MPQTFSGTVQVTTIPGDTSAWVIWMMVLPTIGGALGVTLQLLLWDLHLFWTILLAVAGMVAGGALGFLWWPTHYLGHEGRAFNAQARVELDARGLSIEGLGLSPWCEILAAEADHDAGTTVTIHTERFGLVMVWIQPSELWPILAFHLQLDTANNDGSDGRPYRFVARFFSWPAYRAWILAGHLAAALVVLALLFDRWEMGTLLVAAILAPMIALLVWALPNFNLSFFGESHRHVFQIDGSVLERGDRRWRVDLRTAKVRPCVKTGLTYELAFLAVVPKLGRHRYLLMPDEKVLDAVMRRIDAAVQTAPRMGVSAKTTPPPRT